ncbi:MAG TPA: DUF742 domain-containing protein [Trebonia sp.]|nr:DUF742 domain-containing protein [Trebonia sp.]
MTVPEDETWLDGDAGRLVRPYAVSNGRTIASRPLDLLSMVVATGITTSAGLEPDHLQILGLCLRPASVAEIAARVRLPAAVTKVLLSDLVDCGAVRTAGPRPMADVAAAGATSATSTTSTRVLLERLLDGLQRRL